MALQPGEKYLKIKLAGHEYLAAFKNQKKEKPDQPDYTGDGIAVWIKEKQEPKTEEELKVQEVKI